MRRETNDSLFFLSETLNAHSSYIFEQSTGPLTQRASVGVWSKVRQKIRDSSYEEKCALAEIESRMRGDGPPSQDLGDLKSTAKALMRSMFGAQVAHPKRLAAALGIKLAPIQMSSACITQIRARNIHDGRQKQTWVLFYDGSMRGHELTFLLCHEVAHWVLRTRRHVHLDVQLLTCFLLCPDPTRRRSQHCPPWVRELVKVLESL